MRLWNNLQLYAHNQMMGKSDNLIGLVGWFMMLNAT
jgi:hypothetical protein